MPYIFHGSNLVICIFCSVRVLCGIVLTWIADRSINYFAQAQGKPYALPCVNGEIWNTRLGVFDGPTPGKYRDLLQYNHIYHNTITIGLGVNLLTNIPNIISTSKSIITRSNFSSRSLGYDGRYFQGYVNSIEALFGTNYMVGKKYQTWLVTFNVTTMISLWDFTFRVMDNDDNNRFVTTVILEN